MSEHLTQALADLQKSVIADGVIDQDEVAKIRERLYADSKIDRDEAEFLFAINDAVSGNDNHPSWTDLFVDAICEFVLNDEQSPGEVDEDEAQWLVDRMQRDDKLDDVEIELLKAIKSKANSVGSHLKVLVEMIKG